MVLHKTGPSSSSKGDLSSLWEYYTSHPWLSNLLAVRRFLAHKIVLDKGQIVREMSYVVAKYVIIDLL